MATTERKTEVTATIPVRDSAGNAYTVKEVSTSVRSRYLDNTWSSWNVTSRAYQLQGRHCNHVDDQTFEVVDTGETLHRA